MRARRPVQLHQAADPVLPVTAKPNIAGLARDLEPCAQLRHRLLIAFILKDKSQLLVHRTARFPGHELVFTPSRPRRSVRYVPGPICQVCPRSVPPSIYPPSPRYAIPPYLIAKGLEASPYLSHTLARTLHTHFRAPIARAGDVTHR
jgi:hypothetical protein